MGFVIEQIGEIQKFRRKGGFSMPEPVKLPPGITDESMYKAFEHVWKEINKDQAYDYFVWLQHSDRWGERGYLQPAVHFDWLHFRKGVAFGLVLAQKGVGT